MRDGESGSKVEISQKGIQISGGHYSFEIQLLQGIEELPIDMEILHDYHEDIRHVLQRNPSIQPGKRDRVADFETFFKCLVEELLVVRNAEEVSFDEIVHLQSSEPSVVALFDPKMPPLLIDHIQAQVEDIQLGVVQDEIVINHQHCLLKQLVELID